MARKLKSNPWMILIYAILSVAALVCLLPILHIIAISFSDNAAATANRVAFWPVGFNIESYRMLAIKPEFFRSFGYSVIRLAIGVPLQMIMCVLVAYPLSQESATFRARTVYVWFFALTMFFSGGMIPGYLLLKELKMLDTIWALVLPSAVPIFNAILMLNFFRGIPKELRESAFIDGATHISVLMRIYIPISRPSLATILLFTFLGHWNAWLDGILYMNDPSKYPLSSYLQIMINSINYLQTNAALLSPEDQMRLYKISDQSFRAAQIILGALPVMMIYPMLQKHFVKGLTIGSVKG